VLIQVAAIENVAGIKFTDYDLHLLAQLRKSRMVINGRDEVLAAGLPMGASGGIGSKVGLRIKTNVSYIIYFRV